MRGLGGEGPCLSWINWLPAASLLFIWGVGRMERIFYLLEAKVDVDVWLQRELTWSDKKHLSLKILAALPLFVVVVPCMFLWDLWKGALRRGPRLSWEWFHAGLLRHVNGRSRGFEE